jgi:hypothetical protein
MLALMEGKQGAFMGSNDSAAERHTMIDGQD